MHGQRMRANDWYSDYEAKSEKNPLAVKNGSVRVDRGGGWSVVFPFCRSANRDMFVPTIRNKSIGFRLALSPSIATQEVRALGAEPAGVGTEGATAEQRR